MLLAALGAALTGLVISQGANARSRAHRIGSVPVGDRPAGAGIYIHIPRGWHLIHRRLTEVSDPAQALAVASFPVKLGRPCECGEPHVLNMPRAGVFLFVWEYLNPGSNIKKIPPRPAQFQITRVNRSRYVCGGPGWSTGFRTAGRVFQVEVYFGPHAERPVIARMQALLDSIKVVARAQQ